MENHDAEQRPQRCRAMLPREVTARRQPVQAQHQRQQREEDKRQDRVGS